MILLIHPRMIECFNNLGIIIDEYADNFDIGDFISDSLAFVSFIIELENLFSIEIPDEYLSSDVKCTPASRHKFRNLIEVPRFF
ncbi:MAG: hypothetical protein FWF81_13130 [Defluviitaleaceae bacterium]|nr:hypothetical protein [Defluviitaleaceae bacterium]